MTLVAAIFTVDVETGEAMFYHASQATSSKYEACVAYWKVLDGRVAPTGQRFVFIEMEV